MWWLLTELFVPYQSAETFRTNILSSIRRRQVSDGFKSYMIHVFVTIFNGYPFFPILPYSVDELAFGRLFHFNSKQSYSSSQKSSVGLGFQEDAPPVDSPLLQEGLSNSRSVFWVFFLHKTMNWQCFLNKRNLVSLQNIAIKVSLHNSLEDADFRGLLPDDVSPDVRQKWRFTRCFGFSFRLGGYPTFRQQVRLNCWRERGNSSLKITQSNVSSVSKILREIEKVDSVELAVISLLK